MGIISFLALFFQSPSVLAVAGLCLVVFSIIFTHIFSQRRYNADLKKAHLNVEKGEKFRPPRLPYTFPFIGHSLQFFRTDPKEYWRAFIDRLPTEIGIFTILLGGDVTHMTMDQSAIQQLFISKASMRDDFVMNILVYGFGMEKSHAANFYLNKPAQEDMTSKYLLKGKAVEGLTKTFCTSLKSRLQDQPSVQKVDLLAWLCEHMFAASTTALFGTGVLEVYPEICKDFWPFTPSIVALMLRIPKFWKPEPYLLREKLLVGLTRWQETMFDRCGGEPSDPDGEDWEPIYGARYSRARQQEYTKCGFTFRSRAGADLGLLFGLAGNAVPLTGWIILHILCPQQGESLLYEVVKEVQTAVNPDGSLNIMGLCDLPILQSIYHEALRKYTDLLVARNILETTTLPFDGGERHATVQKGETAMCSTYLSHHSPVNWENPEQFCPYRFLKDGEKDGKECPVFSSSGTIGKLFPFGGGRHACPGRKFAQQEIVAGVAMILLSYDIEIHGFLDEDGKPTDQYPASKSHFPGSGVMQKIGDISATIRRKDMAR